MATREELVSSYNLKFPTSLDEKDKFSKATLLELRIIFLISQVDQNLYSFICGIVTSLPISVLFNLLDMDFGVKPYKWLYFALYILLLIDTVIMTVAVVKFTLQHTKINEKAQREEISETRTNELYRLVFNAMKTFKKAYWVFLGSFLLFVLLVFALFALNNFDFSWLFDANVHNATVPTTDP